MIRVKNENEDIIVLDSNYSIESSDLHNIAESTHVVNISPIAVSAQEILSFTRVDGSTCINMLDLSSRKRKFGQCNRSSNAKQLEYRLHDKKMYHSSDRERTMGSKTLVCETLVI